MAQSINGPSTASPGSTKTYSFSGGLPQMNEEYIWTVSAGGTLPTGCFPARPSLPCDFWTGSSVDIDWSSNGTVYLEIKNTSTNTTVGTYSKSVNVCVSPSTPTVPTTYGCDNTVTLSPSSPSGTYQWFYTNDPTSLPISDGTYMGLTYNVGTNGHTLTISNLSGSKTVYVRQTSTGCGNSALASATGQIALEPTLASGSDVSRCDDGTVTLSATPGVGGDNIKWYSSPTGGNVIHYGSNFTTPYLTNTTTYYAATSSSVSQCEDADRKAIKAIIVEPSEAGTLTGNTEVFGMASDTIFLDGNIVGNVIKWQYRTTGGWNDIPKQDSFYKYSNLQEPTYFQAVVQNGICDPVYSNQVLINVLEEPEVDWGLTPNIRPNVEKTITIESGHASYKWFLEDSLILEGSTELIVPKVGRYKVVVTSTGGAVDTTGWAEIGSQLDMNENAVVTYTYKHPIVDSSNSSEDLVDHFELELEQQNIAVNVFDGLGRQSQSIALNATPSGTSDMLTPTEYDELGRQSKSYLPYAEADLSGVYKPTAVFDPQTQGYQSSRHYNYYTSVKNEDKAYAETRFEASPLNRPLEQGSPGDPWQIGGATVTYHYDIADSAEVILWEFDSLLAGSKRVYGGSSLYKNTTTDEDGNRTIEYTNSTGQTILKKSEVNAVDWAETYYIYDVYGNLAVVFPPEATNRLDSEFFAQNQEAREDFLNTWGFLYEYDYRNRMTMKKVPGADSVFMVYDPRDRLVLTQDGNQRSDDRWLFTKYDELNRPILTGILESKRSASYWQEYLKNPQFRFEALDSTGIHLYSNRSFPRDSIQQYLTVTYYDNYDFMSLPNSSWSSLGLDFNDTENRLTQNISVKDQVTGTVTKAGNDNWIYSVSYYDNKYRLIQAQSTNHLGGNDVVTTYMDFIGQVNRSVSSHSNGDTTITTTRSFVYDHMGRLKETWHKIGDQADSVLIASNRYDDLGQLEEKDLHGGRQSLDYSYNIRGWLTEINNSDLTQSNDDDLFGMKLLYDEEDPSVTNAGLHNGNISGMKWSTPDDHKNANITERAYRFEYDGLNRLKGAFSRRNRNGWSNTNQFRVQLAYDLNGNIEWLLRKDKDAQDLDDLTYDYNGHGNQLVSVSDAGIDTVGFVDGNTSGDDYTYDTNGNMTKDRNKGIDSIYYNHLNLPIKVEFETSGDSITYLYDAAGIKLNQVVYKQGDTLKVTDYVGEFIYETDTSGVRKLQLIQHEEGRIIPKDTLWDYQYHLKDHLGNVRVTFSTEPENYTMVETFETGEENGWQDLHRHTNSDANTTVYQDMSVGDEVELLQSGQTGAMIFLSVNKRDTINLSVQANYESAPSGNNFLGTAYNTLFTSFDNVYGSGVPEGGGVSSSSTVFDDALNGGAMAGKDDSNTAPRAFLNYILFDKDMNYLSAGFTQITTAAQGVGVHEEVTLDIAPFEQDGYVLAYLSNENQEPITVNFDDFTVYHGKTNVVSTQDYYPFGLTFNESVRTASVGQKYLYNGKELQEETGWHDYGARMYMADIGRWGAVDPLSEYYQSASPYNYVLNNPISFIDPDGTMVEDPITNVIVLVADDKHNILDLAKSLAAQGNENWQLIGSDNFEDAANDLNEYTNNGELELDNLIIGSHGAPGGIIADRKPITKNDVNAVNSGLENMEIKEASNGKDYYFNEVEVGRYKPVISVEEANKVKSMQSMASNVKNGGNVIFTACSTCSNENGTALGQALFKAFGGRVNVYLNGDQSSIATSNPETKVQTFSGGSLTAGSPVNGWTKFGTDNSVRNIGSLIINLKGRSPIQEEN